MKMADKLLIHGKLAGLKALSKVIAIPRPILLLGSGASLKLCDTVAQFGASHVLLVTDRVLTELGLFVPLVEVLERKGVRIQLFNKVMPDPTLEVVEQGLEAYKEGGCDAILAFGGGSVIDAAKVIAAAAGNEKPAARMLGLFRVRKPCVPLYVVPTTAGTGSEVTLAAVISEQIKGKTHKSLVIDPKLVPVAAALDARLMLGLPAPVTAATGIDALTHAIEAYISEFASEETDYYARAAVKLIFENLRALCKNGNSLKRREAMALASFYGGLAVTQAGVGYVHAIAHQVGSRYHIPHGEANAIFLSPVLRYSEPRVRERLAELARHIDLGANVDTSKQLAEQFIHAVEQLIRDVGLRSSLNLMKPEDLPELVADALKEAHGTYPVPRYMTDQDCLGILASISAH